MIDQWNGWLTTCDSPSGEYCTGNPVGEWSQKFLMWWVCSIHFWWQSHGTRSVMDPELWAEQRGDLRRRREKEPRGWLCPMKIVACLPSEVPPPCSHVECVSLNLTLPSTKGGCSSRPSRFWSECPHFHQGNPLILFLPEAGGPRDLGWPIKASLPWHALGDTPRASHSPQRCKETSLCR